jgi:hypothetical protein
VRIRPGSQMARLITAFENGEELDYRAAAEVAFVTERTARRYLNSLREMRVIHISFYEYRQGHQVPFFALGKHRSAKNGAERSKLWRERHRKPKMSDLDVVFRKLLEAPDAMR